MFEYSDGAICCLRQLANMCAKHHFDLILILKCLLSSHCYCTKKSFCQLEIVYAQKSS